MDPTREVWPAADLRAGDADRQRVVSELQRHYIDGRLNSDELSERISAALQARTFGDLRQLLRDLPSPVDDSPVERETHSSHWMAQVGSPPLGAALVLIGVLALMWIVVAASAGHWGVFPFWPVLFFFFFIGRPFRGGRRRF